MYQDRLLAICTDVSEVLYDRYGFDLSAGVAVSIEEQKESKDLVLLIQRANLLLIKLSWESLHDAPQHQALVEACSYLDGNHTGVGSIVKIKELYTDKALTEPEQRALGHFMALLLMSMHETVLLEEKDIKSLPTALYDTWCRLYGVREVHNLHVNGIGYLKCDDPASPTAW